MSYLLFIDESGHDHKQMPYEVRGGVVIHASRVWAFALEMRKLELNVFGAHLHDFGSEIKGEKLLNKDRFKWASQTPGEDKPPYQFNLETRRDLAHEFLERGRKKEVPGRLHMTAYGQACLAMAEDTLRLLREQDAKVFATAIPRGTRKPPAGYRQDHLRKDLMRLLERYYYYLEGEKESGLLVMDQSEQTYDRRFSQQIARYCNGNQSGREHARRVVPVPLFVTQDVSYALQAADVCIYMINWAYRLPDRGMNAETRPEIESRFITPLRDLIWHGDVQQNGKGFTSYSIAYVPEPYS